MTADELTRALDAAFDRVPLGRRVSFAQVAPNVWSALGGDPHPGMVRMYANARLRQNARLVPGAIVPIMEPLETCAACGRVK